MLKILLKNYYLIYILDTSRSIIQIFEVCFELLFFRPSLNVSD